MGRERLLAAGCSIDQRLLRSFMRDRGNQLVLGTFIWAPWIG